MNNHKTELKKLSDGEILSRSVAEPWLFGILVEKYQKAFLRKSLGIVRSEDLAEDIVQDTFLKIYKNAESFIETPGASFKSWAYKILLNTCYTYYAKQRREQLFQINMESSDIDMIEVQEEKKVDQRSFVQSILSRMPRPLAKLLHMYFLEGKSQKEIARIEHISPGAVRARMHRGKKYFKEHFKDLKLEIT
jgi:RNA polymerase sigma-70 factor (ECF subfamily)